MFLTVSACIVWSKSIVLPPLLINHKQCKKVQSWSVIAHVVSEISILLQFVTFNWDARQKHTRRCWVSEIIGQFVKFSETGAASRARLGELMGASLALQRNSSQKFIFTVIYKISNSCKVINVMIPRQLLSTTVAFNVVWYLVGELSSIVVAC